MVKYHYSYNGQLFEEVPKEVLDVMKDLAKAGSTMLVVTHEMAFARAIADSISFTITVLPENQAALISADKI